MARKIAIPHPRAEEIGDGGCLPVSFLMEKGRSKLRWGVAILALLGSFSHAGDTVVSPKRILDNFLIREARMIISEQPLAYGFGQHDPERGLYDCSSFLLEVVRRSGKGDFPRSSRGQFRLMLKTSKVWSKGSHGWNKIKPGDLIFFTGTFSHNHDCPISHVMIYVGGGLMLGAQPAGIGYFRFSPLEPQGVIGVDSLGERVAETVYAYARPNWRRIAKLIKDSPEILSLP